MLITRTSTFTGVTHTLDLNVTEDQINEFETRPFGGGRLIQEIFPTLNPSEREFIKTGVTPEEWTAMFGEDDED